MSDLLLGLLTALMATNQPAALSNLVVQSTGLKVSIPDASDPVEREYRKLMEDDDAALDEVDKWIQENKAFADKGAGVPAAGLNARIKARFDPVRAAYEDFLRRHPDHARAHLAYGSFLSDISDEEGAIKEWSRALELDPKNPAAWNDLANHFGHDGPVSKAFEYYAKAIELDPTEAVYFHNLATTVSLFRKDAREFYHIDEQAVFDKSLDLYLKAMKLAPTNFVFATDLASTYYMIKPTRTDDALNAWSNALKVATSDIEREGVYIHLARFELNADRFDPARGHLAMVTNTAYDELKARLLRNLAKYEKAKNAGDKPSNPEPPPAQQTNADSVSTNSPAPPSIEHKGPN